MNRAEVNHKHEGGVCRQPHRVLPVSKFPWQARLWLCQNMGLWHNSAGLWVRPGLLVFCPNQSLIPVWPPLLFLSAFTERTELVQSISETVYKWKQDGPGHGFLEFCQSSKKHGQETQASGAVMEGSILGHAVRKKPWLERCQYGDSQPHFFTLSEASLGEKKQVSD